MKALAGYQVILLGEQRHIRCEQLAQGCCRNNAAVGVEPHDLLITSPTPYRYTTESPIFGTACFCLASSGIVWLCIVAQSFEQLTGLVYQIWLHLTGFTHCA